MGRTVSSIEDTLDRPLRYVAEVAEWLEVTPDKVRRMMKQRPKQPLLMTIPEVAEELRVHRATVYKMMERGELDYRIVGSRRRVRRADLDLYIDRLAS